ncbi:hypothetical protein BDY17DRAFT_303746, partial [Neohortaea acidophila]
MASSKEPSLAQIAQSLFRDALSNIIHDTILHRHRDHKLTLMSLDPTTRLPICDTCKLPRLLDPPIAASVRGASSPPPASTVYCDRKPWCRRTGFDIYGNPFPKADVTGRPPTKKEREAAKSGGKHDGTPASADDGTAPPSPTAGGDDADRKLEKGEKKASKIDEKLRKGEYIPWQTCPNCKRSLLITRFAKHLEQCMGLSGRAASRNALAKMNGHTPAGSRGGTPVPEGSQGGGEDDEEDEKIKGPGGVRKKVLKKGLSIKLKKELPSKTGSMNGKPARPTSSAGGENGSKRDLDEMLLGEDGDDDDTVHVKKRQKMQRVASTASFASVSEAMEMERSESQDGSFVGEELSFGD